MKRSLPKVLLQTLQACATGVILLFMALNSNAQGRATHVFVEPAATFDLSNSQEDRVERLRNRATTLSLRLARVNNPSLFSTKERLLFNGFPEWTFVLRRTKVEVKGEGYFSWHGDIINRRGYALISVRDEIVSGQINTDKVFLEIIPIKPGIIAIIEVDESKFLREAPPKRPEGGSRISDSENEIIIQGENGSAYTGYYRVRALIAYTDDAGASDPYIEQTLDDAVTLTNEAYNNSQIELYLEVVHKEEVIYNETGDGSMDLECIQKDSDSCLDQLHNLRDQYHADVVILVTKTSDVGGVAYLYNGSASWAFSIIKLNNLGYYTLAHEVGHNQGASHNPEENYIDAFPYGHGYLIINENVRTIMAYDDTTSLTCCNLIQYFSNPDVMYDVDDAMGTDSLHDNARALTETADNVAFYRVTPLTDVVHSGPNCINQGDDGIFYSSAENGEPPYYHTWEFKPVCPLGSAGADGGVSTQDVPCGVWSAAGQGYMNYFGKNQDDDFWMRNTVSDRASQSGTSSASFVDVRTSGESPCFKSSAIASEGEIPNSDNLATPKPENFSLQQNYPNPFQAATTFEFALPVASDVSLAIYDVLGRRVALIVDDYLSSGVYRINWNRTGTFLPNGVYFYQLRAANGYVATKRMIVAK